MKNIAASRSGKSRSAYRSLFAGIPASETAWCVVLTPIRALFDSVARLTSAEQISGGWWPAARISLNGQVHAWLVHTPQGSAAADFICACSGAVQKVLCLGFCGSLDAGLQPGSIAQWADSPERPFPDVPALSVCTVPGFLVTPSEALEQSAKEGFALVDMETQWLSAQAEVNSISLQALYVVTDQPLIRPIVSCQGAEDLAAVQMGIEKAATLAAHWVIGRQRSSQDMDRLIPQIRAAAPNVGVGAFLPEDEPESGVLNTSLLLQRVARYFPEAGHDAESVLQRLLNGGTELASVLHHFITCYSYVIRPRVRRTLLPDPPPAEPITHATTIEDGVEMLSALVRKGEHYLIKPNWVSDKAFPETTDSELLHKVVDMLRERGAASITIADDPSLFFTEAPVFSRSRIAEFQEHARVVNLREYGRYIKRRGLEISALIDEVDAVIDLACWKDHTHAGYSGAVKNLMGLMSPRERLRFHTIHGSELRNELLTLASCVCVRGAILDARQMLAKAQQRCYGGVPAPGFGLLVGRAPENIDESALGHYQLMDKTAGYQPVTLSVRE